MGRGSRSKRKGVYLPDGKGESLKEVENVERLYRRNYGKHISRDVEYTGILPVSRARFNSRT